MSIEVMVDTLRKLGELPREAAAIAAPLVDAAIKKTAAASTAPDGTPWAPKKRGGGRPLEHAPEHIETKAIGPVIRSSLSGVDVYHHYGAGVPRRPILPDPGTIPPNVEKALQSAAEKAFEKAVG